MAIIKVKVNDKLYEVPANITCKKDYMFASYTERTKSYECCDCSWVKPVKDYIKENNIQPIEEESEASI